MDTCEKVLTVPQLTAVCWYSSILTICFYSQYMRLLLKNKVKFLTNPDEFQKLFINIINSNFIESNIGNPDDIVSNIGTPEYILHILNKLDSSWFNICPIQHQEGYFPSFYIHRMLNIFIPYEKILYLDQLPDNSYIISSNFLKDYVYSNNVQDKTHIQNISHLMNTINVNYLLGNIDVIIISTLPSNYKNLDALKQLNMYFPIDIKPPCNETLFVNSKQYKLDSVILSNYNTQMYNGSHSIAGITCHNNKYLYNGWTNTTNDPAKQFNSTFTETCKLFPFDWTHPTKNPFYLSNTSCNFTPIYFDLSAPLSNLCFDFNYGNNLHIYVNKHFSNLTFVD